MKQLLFIFSILIVLLISCKKDKSQLPAPPARANFSINADSANGVVLLATYDPVYVVNNSTNASSYHWDFGNDSSSSAEVPAFYYSKSGTYNVTLTAISKEGKKSTFSKTIKVLDRVLKQISVNDLTNYNGANNHILNSNSSIWVVIKLGGNNILYTWPPSNQGASQSLNVPVLFQSNTLNTNGTNFPLVITVPNKIIIDFAALSVRTISNLGYTGVGYGLELYGQDNTGTYLLSSSYQSFYQAQSGAIAWPVADIKKNLFIAQYGSVKLICDYE